MALKATPAGAKLSIKALQQVLGAGPFPIVASTDCLKKASILLQFTPEQHELGFIRLEAFLQLLKEQNPGMEFQIQVDDDGQLTQLLIVVPHAKAVEKFLFKVIGIDSAHIKDIVYDKKEHPRRLYSKMVATDLSSRTGNNEMTILAVALSPTENCATIVGLIRLLIDEEQGAGLELIHSPDMVVLSDRGGAVTAAVKTALPACMHMYCGKHLETNLLARCGNHPLLKKLFWAAHGATGRAFHLRVMEKIKDFDVKHDTDAYEFLSKIKHWRTYEVVERGCNMLHGIRSNNLSEQVRIVILMDIHLQFI